MEDLLLEELTEESISEERSIEVLTEEINFYKQTAGAAIFEIGKRLIEAKAQLDHGEWLSWLDEKVEFSEASAQRFMRIAKEYKNPSPVTDLGMSKALILLALPSDEREEFISQKHDINGEQKDVSEMSKRELEKVMKELQDERELRQKQEEETNKLIQEQEELKTEILKLEGEKEETEAELEKLKNAPIEVNCELTQEQEEQIIFDAKAEFKNQKEALENKIRELNQKQEQLVKEYESKLSNLNSENDKIGKQLIDRNTRLNELKSELDKANNKIKTSTSSDVSVFKAYFEMGKECFNQMLGVVLNTESVEEKTKLNNIIKDFCELIKSKC